ncbi:MAG: response regulator [Verrucomicrobia bacterium]|nr:response regulator [Verrucomicrobiota bacterium]
MHLRRLTKPLFVWACGVVVVISAIAGWFGYRGVQARMVTAVMEEAARCAATFDPAQTRLLGAGGDAEVPPAYGVVKQQLARLLTAAPRMRGIALLRSTPETGAVNYLASSVQPGAANAIQPGDPYPEAAQLTGVREILGHGLPAIDGPAADGDHLWMLGYAQVAERPSAKPGAAVREFVAVETDVAPWRREAWSAAIVRAYLFSMILGLPLVALLVVRRQLEQREAIRNLSAAMEQSHSALMIIDLESRIEYANNGLSQQIGYSRRELIGRDWRDFRVAGTDDAVLSDLGATVRSGRPWEGEWCNRRKSGETYPVRGIVTPVKKRDGSLACFIAVFDDVTDAKRREAELREARDLAQAGDRAKGQFLATMSHEIRTPLNGIVGFTNLLLDTPLSTEQRDFVETIHASTGALIQLTGDILDYARIESGKLKLEALPCDPREAVEDVLDLFAASAGEKKLELLHDIAEDVPATIIVDGGRLRQILSNLVNNAVKFTAAGEVEVAVRVVPSREGASATEATLAFTVRDTGIGIPADQHAQLFRPFNQLDSTSTRKYGGAGLGLAICRNLVTLLHGDIGFASEPGRGSVFTFTIRVPVAAPAIPPPELSGLRVAIASRPGALRRELTRVIGRWQAQIIEADEPAALTEGAWEVALVDLDATAARELAGQPAGTTGLPPRKATAVVPLTLSTEVRTGLRVHFHLLLNKPVHHSALLSWLTGVRPAAPLAAPPPVHFGFNVLVAEDNTVNQRLMQRILTNLGCRWTIAENGQRTLDELRQPEAAFDVVLLDLHMPELDGSTALQRIRAGECGLRAQGLWIIALTADVRQEQRARVLAAGANDFLTKPLHLPELEAAFRRYRTARGGGGASGE